MIIGLAGKSCSGKNTVGSILGEEGILHLDLDKMNHRLLDKYCKEISSLFQTDLSVGEGRLNREALSEIVFSNGTNLRLLEEFIHPKIEEEAEIFIEDNLTSPIILNGATLHRSSLAKRLDCLIWVSSPFFLRFNRAMKRDKRSPVNILKRFHSQRTFNAQQFPPDVDIYKVYNGFSSRLLRKRSEQLYMRIIKGDTL
jgi:dephospho-CoA kinase